ncbi:uncharacterized protein LACBIDRAFT_333785 [Laccaria bicolor S238N-H82]|uniref:Predicted protein n=1 Tax=Laccaria bicolor (strain S238N-H82 / ATCC MYA-4686) TaxID=486041 RepID=B0DX32_LACBS|nr:uncharacterized protein LACBIDRAFT_333785 [Laccaria bicolor S238N-H82]EDR00924.1 predicted protein [Laccaria bicolor S238N-H82]|eukprot:XP_001888518.1 predicted protein [Laccaria bicolor S238N-H82]
MQLQNSLVFGPVLVQTGYNQFKTGFSTKYAIEFAIMSRFWPKNMILANRSNTNAKRLLAVGFPLLPPRSLSGPTHVQLRLQSVIALILYSGFDVVATTTTSILGFTSQAQTISLDTSRTRFPLMGVKITQAGPLDMLSVSNAVMQILFDSPRTGSSTVEITINASACTPTSTLPNEFMK